MTEKQIDTYLVTSVKALGGWAVKFEPIHVAGFPDRICLLPGGRIFFVEVKAPGKSPRALQLVIMDKLKALGFDVYVIDSLESLNGLIKKYK